MGENTPNGGGRVKRKPTQRPSWIIPPQGNPGLCSMDKPPATVTSVSRSESPLDGICLSESEKTAVLTLIREEVTAGDPVFPGCTPIQQPSQGCPLPDPVPAAAVVGSRGSSALPWVGGGLVPCTSQARGSKGNHAERVPRVLCLLQPRSSQRRSKQTSGRRNTKRVARKS